MFIERTIKNICCCNDTDLIISTGLLASYVAFIFQIHQMFNILCFLQFNFTFEKKISLRKNANKSPKNLQETAEHWLM